MLRHFLTFRTGYKSGPHPLHPHPCARHRDESSAASAARESLSSPLTWVWLDSCDEHRNEGGGDARALPQPRLGTARHLLPHGP
ncbi:hypothetical protein CDO29_04820 [Sinorhizobium meliloti]|nr:hypothetical protein CDO29_04820 [Sinorhizobium meliloti]